MSKLSLGPIAKADVVKLSIALPVPLKDDLERYAELHAKTWGAEKMDIATLIPHILTAFLARDRGFRKTRKRTTDDTLTTHSALPHAMDENQ